jgi:DNA (cytosine-5)-methyltransferase 1
MEVNGFRHHNLNGVNIPNLNGTIETKAVKNQYRISFFDAIKQLKVFTTVTDPRLAAHPEFLAMVTHWLASPDKTAPLVSDNLSELWNRYLIAELSARNTQLNLTNLENSIDFNCNSLTIDYNSENGTRFPFPPPTSPSFKFIDLFAGIGGFCLALQQFNGTCVFASEVDKAAKQTYFQNYGKFPYGDIKNFTEITIDDNILAHSIPKHDVLAAGFPCQPFSRAGVSARNSLHQEHGFACQAQGTLFFDIARIVKVKRPKLLLLENVGNLVNHDKGETFKTIRSIIEDELNYSFSYAIIDAQTYVPQRRKRCYMVCVRDREFQFEFPQYLFEGTPQKLKAILEKNPDPSYTISKKLWDGHVERTKRNIARGTGFTAKLADLEKPANTLVARYGKDGKECLIGQNEDLPRMLTIREAARLQGYPEEFVPANTKSQAYKQFGNSVAVPVVIKLVKEVVSRL